MDLLGTLLIVALAAPAQEPPVREVVATVGPVTLLRSDRLFRLVPRSALAAGDQVNSGPGGGTIYLDGKGRTIQLGPGAAALVDADEATTRLMNGEVRAVSEGAAAAPALTSRLPSGNRCHAVCG